MTELVPLPVKHTHTHTHSSYYWDNELPHTQAMIDSLQHECVSRNTECTHEARGSDSQLALILSPFHTFSLSLVNLTVQ